MVLTASDSSKRLSFLICALLVLSPTDYFFEKIDLKNDIFIDVQTQDYVHTDFDSFYTLINKVTVRQFAYILLRPLLFERAIDLQNFNIKNEWYPHAILLQEYLKQFKHLYNYYFLLFSGSANLSLTDKEINSFAIDALFLISGV